MNTSFIQSFDKYNTEPINEESKARSKSKKPIRKKRVKSKMSLPKGLADYINKKKASKQQASNEKSRKEKLVKESVDGSQMSWYLTEKFSDINPTTAEFKAVDGGLKHLKKFNENSSEWKEGHLVREYDDEWYVIDSYDKSIPVNSEQSDMFHMDEIQFDDKPCKYKVESGKAFVKLKEVRSPRLD